MQSKTALVLRIATTAAHDFIKAVPIIGSVQSTAITNFTSLREERRWSFFVRNG
jgi:hypothetical protein